MRSGRLLGATVLVLVLGCALAAGGASAASRNFRLFNYSSNEITLQAAQRLIGAPCAGCSSQKFEMEFEGRPKDGSSLKTDYDYHDWELKWGFSFAQVPNYAAELIYKISGGRAGTSNVVIWDIYTYTYSNESTCQLIGGDLELLSNLECKAEGTKLRLLNASDAQSVSSAAEPQTVAEFHHLAKPARRAFAFHFMTTERVNPCTHGKTPLGDATAHLEVGDVIAQLKPDFIDAEGGTISADDPVGLGIRAVLEKDGC